MNISQPAILSDAEMRHELISYAENHPEMSNRQDMLNLALSDADLYARGESLAHVTASSWIISHDQRHVLLIEHAKYNIMIPPGGHVDPGETPIQAAIRETEEEVGLNFLVSLSSSFFHADVHQVPESPGRGEPAHWHVSVYYPFWNKHNSIVMLNEAECLSHKWVSISELLECPAQELRKMAQKTTSLLDRAR